MAKGQHLSRHQQGIVRRYYEHLDTITITKLQESVSELYLCDSEKKRDQLWTRIEKALGKTGANDARAQKVLKDRDVEDLARLVGDIAGRRT